MLYIMDVKHVALMKGVNELKNTLEFLLTSKGITKSQLARELGVSRQTIIRVVKGNAPSMEIGMKIAKYFGKEVTDIFFSPDVKPVAQRKNGKSA